MNYIVVDRIAELDQKGISNLTIFDADNNINIISVNHLTKITELNRRSLCGIKENLISFN